MREGAFRPAAVFALVLALRSSCHAGEPFLAAPLSGRPAALGGAYGALADDAYAPLWNPAGLGFLSATQLAASYLSSPGGAAQSASFAHPLSGDHGLGACLHISRPSTLERLTSYSLAYGRAVNAQFSLGTAAKFTEEKGVADHRTPGLDLGSLYRFNNQLAASGGVDNLGNKPSATPRLGVAYAPSGEPAVFSMEWLSISGKAGLRTGVEWKIHRFFAARIGLDTLQNPPGSNRLGLTAGLGVTLFGQQFDYAYLTQSRLGRLQSLSAVIRLGEDHPPPAASAESARPSKPGLRPARYSRSEEPDVKAGHEWGEQAPSLYHAVPVP